MVKNISINLLKKLIIIPILFLYIELIHTVNTFTYEQLSTRLAEEAQLHPEKTQSLILQLSPILLIGLTIVFFISSFFCFYSYFDKTENSSRAQKELIISAVLVGIKKVFCVHCMLLGLVSVTLFLPPAILGIKIGFLLSSFLSKHLKA